MVQRRVNVNFLPEHEKCFECRTLTRHTCRTCDDVVCRRCTEIHNVEKHVEDKAYKEG